MADGEQKEQARKDPSEDPCDTDTGRNVRSLETQEPRRCKHGLGSASLVRESES